MNFASTIIATAERVPLPDVIIRTAIHRLCSRTATRLATGNAESGCGWGSLSLWMARQFPHSLVTAVSNSNAQREYIEGEAPTAPDDERQLRSHSDDRLRETRGHRVRPHAPDPDCASLHPGYRSKRCDGPRSQSSDSGKMGANSAR